MNTQNHSQPNAIFSRGESKVYPHGVRLVAAAFGAMFVLVGCGPDPVISGTSCCACLLSTNAAGNTITIDSADADLEPNCLAADGSYEEQSNQCSNAVADFAVNEAGSIATSEPACVESVCQQECADVIELGLQITDE